MKPDFHAFSQTRRTLIEEGKLLKFPDGSICESCGGLLIGVTGALEAEESAMALFGGPGLHRCHCVEEKVEREWRRRAEAMLPHGRDPRTFENFLPRPGAEEALEVARRFALGQGSPVLTLLGVPGCGKSHLLEAIGRYCLDRGLTVRYELAAELVDRLRGSYGEAAKEDYDELRSYYQQVHVLLLDDIGLERPTPYAVEQVTAIVDYRYRNGYPLAVTTNKTFAELNAQEGQSAQTRSRLASRLFDVRSGAVEVVHMTCRDYRRGE